MPGITAGYTSTRSWCDERLSDPADDLYFAVLFSPPRLRGSVRAIASLFVELEAIATRFRELSIARTKLAWWRDELERLDAGNPSHPVTKMLARSVGGRNFTSEGGPLSSPFGRSFEAHSGDYVTKTNAQRGQSGAAAAGKLSAAHAPGGNADTSQLLLADLVTGMELILLEGPVTDLATAQMRAERGMARLALVLAQLPDDASAPPGHYAPLGTAVGLARLLTASGLDGETRESIAAAARNGLAAESRVIVTSPPPLRVLAALAWRKSAGDPASASPSLQRRAPRSVVTAWRAARGHLPRKMFQSTA